MTFDQFGGNYITSLYLQARSTNQWRFVLTQFAVGFHSFQDLPIDFPTLVNLLLFLGAVVQIMLNHFCSGLLVRPCSLHHETNPYLKIKPWSKLLSQLTMNFAKKLPLIYGAYHGRDTAGSICKNKCLQRCGHSFVPCRAVGFRRLIGTHFMRPTRLWEHNHNHLEHPERPLATFANLTRPRPKANEILLSGPSGGRAKQLHI